MLALEVAGRRVEWGFVFVTYPQSVSCNSWIDAVCSPTWCFTCTTCLFVDNFYLHRCGILAQSYEAALVYLA